MCIVKPAAQGVDHLRARKINTHSYYATMQLLGIELAVARDSISLPIVSNIDAVLKPVVSHMQTTPLCQYVMHTV